MEKVPGLDFQAADTDRFAEIDQVHIGVRDARACAVKLKSESVDLVQIAEVSVGYGPDATQALVHSCHYFSYERPNSRRFIQVLQDKNTRLGNAEERVPEFITRGWRSAWLSRCKSRGHSIAGHDAEIGKQAFDFRGHESFMTATNVE